MGLDTDLQRLKGILRQHGLHEVWCASRTSADGRTGGFPPCNCFISEDPFGMQKDPPLRVENSTNIAETTRTHLYADGRTRWWRKRYRSHGGSGEWAEMTDGG